MGLDAPVIDHRHALGHVDDPVHDFGARADLSYRSLLSLKKHFHLELHEMHLTSAEKDDGHEEDSLYELPDSFSLYFAHVLSASLPALSMDSYTARAA